MSLRARVALLILGLFAVGSLVALLRSLNEARVEIHEALANTHALTAKLLPLLWSLSEGNSSDAYLAPSTLAQLNALGREQNFSVQLVPVAQSAPQSPQQNNVALTAPTWFVSSLEIKAQDVLFEVAKLNGNAIWVHADPTAAINKNWLLLKRTYLFRFGALFLFSLIIYLMLGRWLQPIRHIVAGLDEVVKGDYSRKIPFADMPELDQITQRMNNLTGVLGASKADNERLQAEAISAQEQERLRLAQELHDTLGQTLSAIKAMAVSIGLRTQDQLPAIADHAEQIEKIADTAYGSVRDLMGWLRPVVLDELGLAFGLQQLVDDWNVHHENIFCRLSLETALHDLSDEQQINIYRIVQEALTNVVKHSQASEVVVQLSGFQVLSLVIADNGRGFEPEAVVKGMGMRGLYDRVNLLQGNLEIHSRPEQGVSYYIEIPRHPSSHRRRHE